MLLPGAVVRSGATVVRVVIDDAVEVCGGVSVGEEAATSPWSASARPWDDVGAGGRYPEADD